MFHIVKGIFLQVQLLYFISLPLESHGELQIYKDIPVL